MTGPPVPGSPPSSARPGDGRIATPVAARADLGSMRRSAPPAVTPATLPTAQPLALAALAAALAATPVMAAPVTDGPGAPATRAALAAPPAPSDGAPSPTAPAPSKTASPASTASANPPLAWSASRKLTWDDFKGPVPSPAPAFTAESHCTLRAQATAEVTSRRSGNAFEAVARIAACGARATFEPDGSWARPAGRSAALLDHEQLHFDLTEIQARKLGRRLSTELGNRSWTAQGATAAEAENAAQAALQQAVDRVTQEESDALSDANKRYDAETQHGTKPADQARWKERVAALLRSTPAVKPRRRRRGAAAAGSECGAAPPRGGRHPCPPVR